jgi:hypothetical protein
MLERLKSAETGALTALSLDLKSRDHILIGTMSRLRTAIVAVVTLAVAAFPLAGASAQGVASEASPVSVHAGCEKHMQMDQAGDQVMSHQAHADHGQGQGHCGKLGGCGKCMCFGLSAVLATAQNTLTAHVPLVKAIRVADSATSLAYIPPSPPPRV